MFKKMTKKATEKKATKCLVYERFGEWGLYQLNGYTLPYDPTKEEKKIYWEEIEKRV